MRTIAEMARSILRQKSLSLSFWPYAVMYAYLKNLLPHKAIDFDIPYEKLYKKSPNLKQIRQFGSTVFVLDQSVSGKFVARSRPVAIQKT